MVRTQRIPPQMINAIIKVEKLRADDEFYNAHGIEEEDVDPSIQRLQMENDAALKEIVDEWEDKSKAFLESKKDETARIMQAAEEHRARIEAEGKEAIAQKGEENKTDKWKAKINYNVPVALVQLVVYPWTLGRLVCG